MTTTTLQKSSTRPFITNKIWVIGLLLISYLLPMFLIWQTEAALWTKLTFSLGLPFLLALISLLIIVGVAQFLPELDRQVGIRTDRTIYNSDGNYEATFLKTGKETQGTYELIRVEIAPQGGNEWHYHKSFEEQFTVLKGQLTVGLEGKKILLSEGETATVDARKLHFFRNDTDTTVTIMVQVSPALGLEKSVRVGYGLANTGQWKKDALFPHNPWHLFLLLGYSETYLPHLPGFIQEPLVNALAKIAQWKGESRALETFFK